MSIAFALFKNTYHKMLLSYSRDQQTQIRRAIKDEVSKKQEKESYDKNMSLAYLPQGNCCVVLVHEFVNLSH